MEIQQITDLHIPDGDDDRYAAVKPNIERQLQHVSDSQPDLLVISGDLSMTDGSREACEWLCDQLPDLPTVFVPGNHDDLSILWDVFGEDRCHDPGFVHAMQFGDLEIVFLDSSTYRVSAEQIDFLKRLTSHDNRLLFVHHPPCLIGSGFMSIEHALENHEELADAIQFASIKHVFCGHFHNVADVSCRDFEVHLTPSPAFQLDLENPEFALQEFEPGVREITANQDGIITTNVVYV